jgi:hypothetical protein
MATTINAGTSTGGAAISADTTGILQLQSGSTPTTAVTIDASRNVGIGTSSPTGKLNVYDATSVILSVDGDAATNIRSFRASTDTSGPQLTLRKSRGTTTAQTAVATNDFVGLVNYQAYDGATYRSTAQIQGLVETYTAANDLAGALIFATRPTGAGGVIAEQMRITSSGDLRFNSGYGSAATAYGCRAWVNFNGTGTVAIRASGNVSSITDNGTGDYTVNFSTAMPDANYSMVGTSAMRTGDGATALVCISTATAYTASLIRIKTFNGAGGAEDFPTVDVSVFR